MAQVWAILKMIQQWWTLLLTAIGMIKKAEHEHKQSEIADETKKAGNPDLSEEERRRAAKEIEDSINRHT